MIEAWVILTLFTGPFGEKINSIPVRDFVVYSNYNSCADEIVRRIKAQELFPGVCTKFAVKR